MVHCTFWALVSGSCYQIIESDRELSEHRWRLTGGGGFIRSCGSQKNKKKRRQGVRVDVHLCEVTVPAGVFLIDND